MTYPEPQPEQTPLSKMPLLFWGMILGLLAFGLFNTKCDGAEITHASFEYPAEVAGMSDGDFFDWATEYNEQQVREIKRSSEPKWLHRPNVRVRTVAGLRVLEFQPTRYLNPDYIPPTSLMVLNPYCRP